MNYIERVHSLRKENNLNQTQVSEIISVAQTTYSDYEKGKVRMPIEVLISLAEHYDVDMNYICGLTDRRNSFPG